MTDRAEPRRLRRLAPANWLTLQFPEVAQFSVPVERDVGTVARAWYDSPAYQPLKAIRHVAARNNAVLIGG
jgi:uncharacterized protein (DUF1330 family)